MRIALFVSHLMMTPVNRRPASRAALQCGGARPGQDSSQPARRHKSTMREQAVVSNPNRKSGCEVETEEKYKVNWPRPEPESKQAKRMEGDDKKTVGPIQTRGGC
jgi:hypothetical protein